MTHNPRRDPISRPSGQMSEICLAIACLKETLLALVAKKQLAIRPWNHPKRKTNHPGLKAIRQSTGS